MPAPAVARGAATLIVRFDPAVASLAACTPVGPFDGLVCVPGAGEVRISLLASSGFTGAAPVVQLVMRAADGADVGDTTTLAVALSNFSDVNGAALR